MPPIGAGSSSQKIDASIPSKGRTRRAQASRSRTSSPPQIGCQRIWFSGNTVPNLIPTDWTKESKTLVLALFRFTFVRTKVNPGFGGGAPAEKHRIPGAEPPARSHPPGGGRISPLGAEPPANSPGHRRGRPFPPDKKAGGTDRFLRSFWLGKIRSPDRSRRTGCDS